MFESNCKKYLNLENFNKDASHFVQEINLKTPDLAKNQKIVYYREHLSKNILNSYLVICEITTEIKDTLLANNKLLKFSMDNMIKNRLSHPEVLDADYEKIPDIVKSPSKYYKSKSGYDIILFKEDDKFYKLIIKTTKNKDENFVKSLHFLNKDRYNKY